MKSHICKLILMGFISIFLGCSFGPVVRKQREIDPAIKVFSKPIVEEYFLPYLPLWANSSQSFKCQRETDIFFLDIQKVMQSFNFSYTESLQLQYLYNILWQEFKKEHERNPNDEEEGQIFIQSKERVIGNLLGFPVPRFQQIHFVLVDSFIQSKDPSNVKKLHQLVDGDLFHEGYPIFISLCLTQKELKRWVEQQNFSTPPQLLLSAEMVSVFNEKGEKNGFFHYNIVSFFRDDQEIQFFLPKNQLWPLELIKQSRIKINYF